MVVELVLLERGSRVRLGRNSGDGRNRVVMSAEYPGGRGGNAGREPDSGEATARRGASPPAQLACRAADEDVVGGRIQHPIVALARVVVVTRHLDEALVEAEVVPDRVLPALLVLAVVREVANDELVDAVERQSLVRAAADRHHNHGVVAVRRFLGRR